MAYDPPRHYRSCLGLLLAPIAGTTIFTAIAWLVARMPIEDLFAGIIVGNFLSLVFVAGPATLIAGFPLYFLLRGRTRATVSKCMSVGAIVGALPALVLLMIAEGGLDLESVLVASAMVASGAFGGLVFWRVAAGEINRDFEAEA